jgi:dihydrofolate synthase / folylpolyglutamate synthase
MAQPETSGVLLDRLKQLYPVTIELSLDRLHKLLVKLGDPHKRMGPVVHVAGTNGKGSTCAYLAAMATAAGLRVHWYSSPHLVSFHERIRLADQPGQNLRMPLPITEQLLIDALTRVERANAGDPITFFEITTAAAFLAFAEHPADLVILEVGLGGKFDATNVIDRPLACIITPVSIDHAEYLGDTLAKIAGEKAGILKRGVKAIIAGQADEALDTIRAVAQRVGAQLVLTGEDFDAFEQRGRLVFQNTATLLDLPKPALVGRHQIANAGTAIAAALEIPGMSKAAIERGLTTVQWPARMQRLTGGTLSALVPSPSELWLDGGHNPAGGQALAQTIADLEERASKPLIMIVGMMGTKDAAGFLTPFVTLASHVITVPVPAAHEAPMKPELLAKVATELGLVATSAKSVPDALVMANRLLPGSKRVLICGSLYLAGHVLTLEAVSGEPPVGH